MLGKERTDLPTAPADRVIVVPRRANAYAFPAERQDLIERRHVTRKDAAVFLWILISLTIVTVALLLYELSAFKRD